MGEWRFCFLDLVRYRYRVMQGLCGLGCALDLRSLSFLTTATTDRDESLSCMYAMSS